MDGHEHAQPDLQMELLSVASKFMGLVQFCQAQGIQGNLSFPKCTSQELHRFLFEALR